MADELTLNFLVGLASTAIIFYGVQLQGRCVALQSPGLGGSCGEGA